MATGAVDIPLKLPAPDFGTDAQPVPKSADAVDPDGMADALDPPAAGAADADEAADDGADEDEADVLPVLLQAAPPKASPAATADTARMRLFTISP
ncbi:MAG: hypothetical protein ABSF03_11630 [Streptosporangiaceae bacterium]